ncbi:MAG TPA: TRAP transporter large permease [Bacteroidota bacterium]|jgi:tripartite ATP-independent transporter DctM subunit|nr:TRAP transporter large permease [Bacteroidota bacterium]
MVLTIAGIVLILLGLLGMPIFAIVAAVALLAFHLAGIDTAAIIVELFRLGEFPGLIAIPLFTFAGHVLADSKAPTRLMNFIQALFGWLPGGMAIVAIFTTALFTAFTGASGITIIALGGLLYPSLLRFGYPEKFSLGLMTTSGSLGLLFPPSLPIILYALVAKINLNTLFVAGIIPGTLLLVILSAYSVRVGIAAKVQRIPFSFGNVLTTLKEAAFEIPLPLIILGGIYGGIFTATEAASITAIYAIIVEVFIRKDLRLFADIPRIIRQSMVLVGAVILMLGVAMGLTNYLVDQEIPGKIFDFINTYVNNKYGFLLIFNAILLGINTLEVFSSIIVIVPIIMPIAARYEIDPVHLGIMFLMNLEIGYMIPPLSLNCFLASSRFKKPLPEVFRAVVPFLVLLLAALLLITFVPEISLVLTRMAGME